MIRAALVLAALAGCIDDHYTCTRDSDCNLGQAGRCELDHQCTQYDSSCPLARSYSAHSGELSGKCFVEPSTLVDPCAAGQPAAPPDDPCAARVCPLLPSCCNTGWSEACVQQAQVTCKPKCDTRLAVTAWKGNAQTPNSQVVFDLRFDGSQWTTMPTTRSTFLEWIAPSPGDPSGQPRLAGLDASAQTLLVGDDPTPQAYPVPAGRTFDTLASVDFDRSGHDLAMLASNDITQSPSDGIAHYLIDLGTGDTRGLTSTLTAPLESWGDLDGDAFPDAVAATGSSASYHFVANVDDPSDHSRELDDGTGATGGAGGAPAIGAFVWADFDGDTVLDLAEIGTQINIHGTATTHKIFYMPTAKLDCAPVVTYKNESSCKGVQLPDDVGFVGTAVPMPGGGVDLVVGDDDETPDANMKSTWRSLALWQVPTPTVAGFTSANIYSGCTGMGIVGSTPCNVFRAVVARDLDGDGVLDLVAIDNDLRVFVFQGEANGTYRAPGPPMTLGAGMTSYAYVRVSISGALR